MCSAASSSAASNRCGYESGSSRLDAHAGGGGNTDERLPLSAAVTVWLDRAARASAAAPSHSGQSRGRRSAASVTSSTCPPETAADVFTDAARRAELRHSPPASAAAIYAPPDPPHGIGSADGLRSHMAAGLVALTMQLADTTPAAVPCEGVTSKPARDGAPNITPVYQAAGASKGDGSADAGRAAHVMPADVPAAAQPADALVRQSIVMGVSADEAHTAAAVGGALAVLESTEGGSIGRAQSQPVYALAQGHSAATAPHTAPQAAGEPQSWMQPNPPVPDAAPTPLGDLDPTHHHSASPRQSSLHAGEHSTNKRAEHRPPLPPASAGRRAGSSLASAEGRGSSLRALKLRLSTTRGAAALRGRPQSAPSSRGAGEPLLQPRWSIAQPRPTSPSRDPGQARSGSRGSLVPSMVRSYPNDTTARHVSLCERSVIIPCPACCSRGNLTWAFYCQG